MCILFSQDWNGIIAHQLWQEIFINHHSLCFFFFSKHFYLFNFACTGSSLLSLGSLQLQRVGAILQSQMDLPRWPPLLQSMGSKSFRLPQLYGMGSVAVAHGLQLPCGMWSLPQTPIPCLGNWAPNPWTTEEILVLVLSWRPTPEPLPTVTTEEHIFRSLQFFICLCPNAQYPEMPWSLETATNRFCLAQPSLFNLPSSISIHSFTQAPLLLFFLSRN